MTEASAITCIAVGEPGPTNFSDLSLFRRPDEVDDNLLYLKEIFDRPLSHFTNRLHKVHDVFRADVC
jgi:hypothetical protein